MARVAESSKQYQETLLFNCVADLEASRAVHMLKSKRLVCFMGCKDALAGGRLPDKRGAGFP